MGQMVELMAEARDATGKAAMKEIRKQGMTPAVLYGGDQPPQNLTVERKAIAKHVETGHFLSTVYTLNVGGKKIRAIPREVQLDVVRDFPIHVDFLRVTASSRLDVDVAVHFINEQDAPGLKRGGVLNVVRHEVELNCPANNIPESVEVDLTGLDIGDTVHMSAVKLPANVKPVIERDFTIATVAGSSAMRSEEDGEEAAAEEDK
ncbi:MAG: 50S ribosomal protein L25/general stress protein Ctc [Alphaproteobacteria bacterium]